MKKGIMMFAAALAMLVCLCFGVAACAPTEQEKDETFPAPTGIKVEKDVLSWTALEGAAAYTVKINSDETTKVSVASLDLATVTAKLTAGENTLSVKANATADKKESLYSQAVKYTYTPQEEGKKAFPVPANVKVEGDTFKWDAVEGAVSYTVKINSDESQNAIKATSLDLKTVTAKLVKGANTLAVKANATADKSESAYSASVTYTYRPDSGEEASDYQALVEAIGAITKDSTKAEADAVKAAIEAAETKYGGLSEEAKALQTVADAKAAFDTKKKAYDDAMAAAETLHTAFKNAVNAASATVEAKASLTALKTDRTAAETAYSALTTLAKGLVTEAEQTAYDAIAKAVSEWEKAIGDEKTKLGVEIPALTDDASAEEIIAAADKALAGYNDLPAYVTSDGEVSALKADIDQKKTAAAAKLAATVEALETEIKAALQEKTETNKENYEALSALQARADALGAYAKELYASKECAKDLAAAIGKMQSEVVETKTAETVLYNNDTTDLPSVVIVKKYVNFVGEGAKLEETPAVTASEKFTVGGMAEAENPLTPTVAWNEENRTYTITITLSKRLEYNNADNADTAVVKYKIGSENEVSYTFRAPRGIVYFDAGLNDEAYNEEGRLTVYGADASHDTVVDIYRAGDVVKDGRTASLQFKDVPIASETAASLASKNELRRAIAGAGVTGDITVQLFAHQRWEEGGQVYVSASNSASVSAVIELKGIASEEAKPVLESRWLSSAIQNEGQFELYTPGFIDQINAQINRYSKQTNVTLADESDMQKYLQARIRAVTVGEEDAVTVLHEEVVEMKFIAYKTTDFVSAWTLAYFKEHLAEYEADPQKADPAYTGIKYQICYEPKETVEGKPSPLCEVFRASAWLDVKQGDTATFDVTLNKADVRATNVAQLRFNGDGSAYEFLRDPNPAGCVFTVHKADRILLDITKGTAVLHLAFFYEEGKVQIWRVDETGKKTSGEHALCEIVATNDVANSWCTNGEFDTWIRSAFSDVSAAADFSTTEGGWTYKTKIVIGAASDWLFDGDWSEAVTYRKG